MINFTSHQMSVNADIYLKRLLAVFLLIPVTISLYAYPMQHGEEKVTIREKDVPLRSVLRAIKKQTGYNFFYTQEYVNDERKVSLDVKDWSVESVLQSLLGAEYEWVYNKEAVSIRKKKWEERMTNPVDTVKDDSKAFITVVGKVTDTKGNSIPGATILIKGSKDGTTADSEGDFVLQNVALNTVLMISSVGYERRELPVKGRSIMARLNLNVNELDVTIIQGYGTTTRRLATGNIAKVTAEEIQKQPVMNPLLALQGKVAGLDVTQTSGYASAPIKVELRGRSAINGSFTSDPLYIIDGVPLTILEIGANSSYNTGSTGFLQTGVQFNGPANGQSPLFSINPADIESIEVLKDADATAIYGSRGANGVILITTKKGRAGKTKFDLHIQEGVTSQSRFWQLLNTPQYLQMRREALKNDGIIPSLANGDYDLLMWDTTKYTDWQKAIYGGMGNTTDVQASISGGEVRTNFRLGVGYNKTTNILAVSGADQRASVSFNMTHRSNNERLSVSFTSAYNYTKSDMISIPGGAITLPPNAPPIYDSLGKLNYAGWGGQSTSARSAYPFAILMQPYTSRTNFLNSNLVLNYEPIKRLKFSTSLGYSTAQANQQQFNLIASQDPLNNPTGSSNFGINNNKIWIIEPQVNYDASLLKGNISLMIGASLQKTTTDGTFINGNGYTSDALIKTISNAASQYSTDIYGEYRYAAIFGRVTYNWANKYIVNLNIRRDGSSRFGAGKQFGNFGSIGGAWIFTEEDWLKQQIRFLSFGKLRASYGTTGSDLVGDYQYLTRWSSNNTRPYNDTATLAPTQHANPNFQWQVNKKFETGIELGFLKDRINISFAYYRNRCGNQLIGFPLPAFSGFTSVTANSPALVQNDGWEVNFGARIVETENFKWGLNFNISANHNKLIAYPNFELSPYVGQLEVGQPLNIVKLLHYTGVDPQTGLYTFVDKGHDGQLSTDPGPTDDRYIYNLSPKFLGGLGMNFSYKTLQFSLFFNIKKQLGINAIKQGNLPGGKANQPVGVLDRWQKIGDNASVARFTTQPDQTDYYFAQSDAGYTDASFIRLSNLSLSYSLPGTYIKKIGLQDCSIFFNTNNLFVITKYKGLDPETQNFGGLPPIKVIVAGLALKF